MGWIGIGELKGRLKQSAIKDVNFGGIVESVVGLPILPRCAVSVPICMLVFESHDYALGEKMLKLLWLGSLLLPLIALGADGGDVAKVYRWVGKDGVVHFSSTPPPGVKAKELELQEPNMVIHQENRSQLLEQGARIGDSVEAIQARRQQLQQQVDDAKMALEQARQVVADGEAPLPEEVQPIVGRGIRLTEAYHQRRAAEVKRVEQIEQQIEDLYQQLNALR